MGRKQYPMTKNIMKGPRIVVLLSSRFPPEEQRRTDYGAGLELPMLDYLGELGACELPDLRIKQTKQIRPTRGIAIRIQIASMFFLPISNNTRGLLLDPLIDLFRLKPL